jgi:hypothetical protein
MKVVSITSSNATIIFKIDELLIIHNALIEVLEYLDDSDCHARTGYYLHEINSLLSFIQEEIMMVGVK